MAKLQYCDLVYDHVCNQVLSRKSRRPGLQLFSAQNLVVDLVYNFSSLRLFY